MTQAIKSREYVKLPVNVKGIYDWLYNKKDVYDFFDNQLWVNCITLGFHKKLVDSVAKELRPGQQVLQFGGTFGLQIEEAAYEIGDSGELTLIDNNKKQLKRCEKKYDYLFTNIKYKLADVTEFQTDKKYDCVICYNLLHELPPLSKVQTVSNALKALKPGGKAVFVDYHNPVKWHPLRYFMRMFNRLYQPFAEKIWERSIDTYAQNVDVTDYTWTKSIYGLGMYQKVTATKRGNLG